MTTSSTSETLIVRPEAQGDADMIHEITQAAFANAEHRSGTEGAIVDTLRQASALTVSLVTEEGEMLVGHVAFSPVKIDGCDLGWFGLGPLSVRPDRQGLGIGAQLVRDGLASLRAIGAQGCVVMGDPAYYERFGFRQDDRLRYPGVPEAYFMALAFGTEIPNGIVVYHSAFEAAEPVM